MARAQSVLALVLAVSLTLAGVSARYAFPTMRAQDHRQARVRTMMGLKHKKAHILATAPGPALPQEPVAMAPAFAPKIASLPPVAASPLGVTLPTPPTAAVAPAYPIPNATAPVLGVTLPTPPSASAAPAPVPATPAVTVTGPAPPISAPVTLPPSASSPSTPPPPGLITSLPPVTTGPAQAVFPAPTAFAPPPTGSGYPSFPDLAPSPAGAGHGHGPGPGSCAFKCPENPSTHCDFVLKPPRLGQGGSAGKGGGLGGVDVTGLEEMFPGLNVTGLLENRGLIADDLALMQLLAMGGVPPVVQYDGKWQSPMGIISLKVHVKGVGVGPFLDCIANEVQMLLGSFLGGLPGGRMMGNATAPSPLAPNESAPPLPHNGTKVNVDCNNSNNNNNSKGSNNNNGGDHGNNGGNNGGNNNNKNNGDICIKLPVIDISVTLLLRLPGSTKPMELKLKPGQQLRHMLPEERRCVLIKLHQ